METNVLNWFRRSLALRREALWSWLERGDHPGAFVPAAGSVAEAVPVASCDVLTHVDEALARIQTGAFGQCTMCDGEVEPERLVLDFTTTVCLDHYSATQIRALERDLELAAQVQQHLLPCCVPALPGVQIAAHARPAEVLSGDYYDFFCSSGAAQGMAIADVMGKGLAASMLMANLQASLRILGPEYDEPHALAGRLNELLRYNLKLIRFISLFLLTVDAEAGEARYCNAGHNPPLRWDAASRSASWLRPTGPALGLLHDAPFRTETVPFRPGDLLLLYTDGLVEARDEAGEAFGEERLAAYAAAHHHESADAFLDGLWRTAHRFTAGRLEDDTTLLIVKRVEA